jgi:hypothetical protein
MLKKLLNKPQRFEVVVQNINEVKASKKGTNIRVLEHLLSYAEYQFGKAVTGIGYRERDGEGVSNFNVDIMIFHGILLIMTDLHKFDNSLSEVIRYDMMFPYLERSLSLLNPYLIHLESDGSNGMDKLDESQIETILLCLIQTDQNMAAVCTNRRQFDMAEWHCQRCLEHCQLCLEGEDKITSMFSALKTLCSLREHQGDLSGALTFAEEGYNVVVEAYDPVHPQVQVYITLELNISKSNIKYK